MKKTDIAARAFLLTKATGLEMAVCKDLLEAKDSLDLNQRIRSLGNLALGRRKKLASQVSHIQKAYLPKESV
jgi:hypothetical protein